MQTIIMDPKLSGLDPKLKEAYDRVMNGPSTPPAPQGQPQAPVQPIQPQPQPQSQPAAQAPAKPVIPAAPLVNSAFPQPQATQSIPIPEINSTVAFNANNSGINKNTTADKKSGGMGKVLAIGVVILILLVIYTFVWIFVLKLKVPFLPGSK